MQKSQVPVLQRKYTIFELSDGGPVRIDVISGCEAAIRKAHEFARDTRNEIRVMYLPDNVIVAVVNQNFLSPEAA